MFCREAVLVNHEQHRAEAHVLYCRSWRCPVCQPKRRAEVLRLIEAGLPERLITLTTTPDRLEDADARARNLVKAWREIVRRFEKLHPGKKIQYLAVLEATKKGEPHMHIVQRGGFIPQKWLSEQLEELVGAWNADIRYIYNPAKAGRYVAKYLGKDLHQFEGCKRYWRTMGWNLTPEDDTCEGRKRTGQWHRAGIDLAGWAAIWTYAGWKVSIDGDTATAVMRHG